MAAEAGLVAPLVERLVRGHIADRGVRYADIHSLLEGGTRLDVQPNLHK